MDTLLRDPFREALAAAVDVPLAELFARRDPDVYPAFERGELTEDAYWAAMTEAGIAARPADFHRARRDGYAWLDGMRELLASLDGRVRRVVASNYPIWLDEVADGWLAGLVDEVHGSYRLGARKPDPEFFRRLCDAVVAPPERMLFVDDREINVAAARSVGMAVVHFTGAASVHEGLSTWLPGQPRSTPGRR
jgi:HAD superfamily hydrolase (TIGR01509 family)